MIFCPFRVATPLSVLTLSLIVFLSQASATTLHSLRVEAAAQEVHDSIDATDAILDQLPVQIRRHVNTEIRLLVHSINRSLGRLERQHPLIIDHAAVHDLNFVADIVRSVFQELSALEPSVLIEVNEELSGRLDELSAAAFARLNQIDSMTDQWIERKNGFHVQAKSDAGFTEVRYFNRSTLDAVRYIGIILFLIGFIIVAVLLQTSKNNHAIYGSFIHRSSFLSKLILGVYFSACVVLAMLPKLLVGMSAETEMIAQEHPCQSLQNQSHHLGLAQRLDSKILIKLTKQRMQMAAVDCLGVADAEATGAVEQLAVKMAPTRVARSWFPAQEPSSIAVSTARVATEMTRPKAQSAEPLPDRIDSNSSENLDGAAATKDSPERPGTTLDFPTTKAAPRHLKAKSPTSSESQHEMVREAALAALAARISKDEAIPRALGTPTQSVRFESKTELVMLTDVQEKRGEIELYLHFSGPYDRELVEELGNLLRKAGYKIAGTELVKETAATGDIRYRHQDQEKEVENIRTISEKYLNKNLSSRQINLKTVDIGGRYPNQPRNRIELWLPQLKNS